MKQTALLTVIACLVLVSSPSARTWYITADGSGDAPTIQAGVDSAASEDTVLVAAGTYDENILIDGYHYDGYLVVYLISESGPQSTTIVGVSGYGVIEVGYATAKIEGFSITGGSSGISYSMAGAEVYGNRIWGCDCAVSYFYPDAWSNPSPQVKENVIYSSGTAISINAATSPNACCASNTIYGCATGISIHNPNGFASQVHRNIISGCTYTGILQATYCDPYSCTPPVLEYNVVWGNHRNYRGTDPGETDMIVCPKLCFAHLADFRVCYDSPCLPENNPYGCHVGACDAGCECGPSQTESTTWGAIKAMYR